MKKAIKIQNKKIDYTVRVSKRAKRMRLAVYCDGNFVVTIPFGFNETLIERFIRIKANWVINKIDYFKKLPKKLAPANDYSAYIENKDAALKIAKDRVKYFNNFYKFRYNKIAIKRQKTRWGSCSKRGNLNFNYKIALLPPELVDYLVVHELCHLKEFNHSNKFWALVAKTIPNHTHLKKILNSQIDLR